MARGRLIVCLPVARMNGGLVIGFRGGNAGKGEEDRSWDLVVEIACGFWLDAIEDGISQI